MHRRPTRSPGTAGLARVAESSWSSSPTICEVVPMTDPKPQGDFASGERSGPSGTAARLRGGRREGAAGAAARLRGGRGDEAARGAARLRGRAGAPAGGRGVRRRPRGRHGAERTARASARRRRSACSPWCPRSRRRPSPSRSRETPSRPRCDHPGPVPGAVAVAPGRRVAALPAPDIGVLSRIQIDREPEGMHRPRAGAAATRARRGHRLPAFERAAEVAVPRAVAAWPVGVGQAHVADRETQLVEPPEHARERARGALVDDQLSAASRPPKPR